MSARVHTRIEPELKRDVSAIFARLGLSEGDAIRIFYNQVKLHDGLPFPVRIPNQETAEAMAEIEADEDLPRYKTFGELRLELDV